MGLGGLKRKLDLALVTNAAVSRWKDLMNLGTLRTSLAWFSGAFAAYVLAEVLRACPTILSQAPAVVGIGLTASVGFWLKVPQSAKDLTWKVLLIGGLSAGWVALQHAFGEACPSIAANWWGFFSSLALGGLHLFVRGPKENA